MTQAASQATAFYREVAEARRLWTIREVPAYAGFLPHEISWEDFSRKWVPGLTRDGILVGVNWSGESARGHDVEPEVVLKNIEGHAFDVRA